MKVSELIQQLQECPPDAEVCMVFDDESGMCYETIEYIQISGQETVDLWYWGPE